VKQDGRPAKLPLTWAQRLPGPTRSISADVRHGLRPADDQSVGHSRPSLNMDSSRTSPLPLALTHSHCDSLLARVGAAVTASPTRFARSATPGLHAPCGHAVSTQPDMLLAPQRRNVMRAWRMIRRVPTVTGRRSCRLACTARGSRRYRRPGASGRSLLRIDVIDVAERNDLEAGLCSTLAVGRIRPRHADASQLRPVARGSSPAAPDVAGHDADGRKPPR